MNEGKKERKKKGKLEVEVESGGGIGRGKEGRKEGRKEASDVKREGAKEDQRGGRYVFFIVGRDALHCNCTVLHQGTSAS